MNEYATPTGDSALDLSVLPVYNNSSADVSQFSPSHVIMLPASAITVSGSDNIPFYISPSGQLILANTTVERVNEGLVFKQSPLTTVSASCATADEQEPLEQLEFDETSEPEASNDAGQKLLNQKVRKLASKVYKDSFTANGSIIVGGYNVTKLAFLADRLKRYRTTRALSQAKLSRKIAETTTGGLKFSQSFLCRFEKLDVTLRAALGAQPYLEQWLDQAESEEQTALGTSQRSSLHPNETMVDLLDLRERAVSEGDLEPLKCFLPARRNRKSRAVFSEAAVEQMTQHFKRNSRPRGEELSRLADSIGYERESVRIWFSNRRYQLGVTPKR
ncbi:POU domain clas 6 transcription factor 1 [Taenia crassiceps]|uniref:POU domain clas 6 transcription factor 1 n=1 Tax=Taenia crassiceps TaxID=6207 RepID=A0ABR4QQY6_9CEST